MTWHGSSLAAESGRPELPEAVASGRWDEVPERIRALCEYAARLTLSPWAVAESDVEALRDAGFTDEEIVDANQVVAYFAYANRVVEGLGAELENSWPDEVRAERHYTLRDLLG